jgi:hypothetical protein
MPWERDLAQLERAITALTAEYDAFLYGTARRPPVASRRNVERMVHKLAMTEPDNAASAFRFANLQAHWNRLLERWEHLQEEKEAGRRPGLYGHFRPSEGAPRAGTLRPETSEGAPFLGSEPGDARPSREGVDRANAAAPGSVRPEAGAADPRRALYLRYLEAKKARGEASEGVDFERFADSLEREKNRLKDRFGGVEVEFDVAERDGRIKLVARKKS